MKHLRQPGTPPEVLMTLAGAVALAVCSFGAGAAGAVALGACSFAVPTLDAGAGNIIDIQLTPVGAFKPSDGRDMPVDAWRIDAAIAARVIERFKQRRNPAVLDYEHQTLRKEDNGQPAPAAGWLRALQWREGSGLWATVELTERAVEYIRAGEYKYISPVFFFDPQTGEVLTIQMAAFTNTPAIDGMEPLALRAAATFGFTTDETHEEPSMKLLAAILAALALPQTTTEDQAIAALTAVKPKLDALDQIRKDLGVEEQAMGDGAAVVAACSTLRTAAAAQKPDPSKFVSVDVVESLKGDIAALTAKQVGSEVDALVKAGLEDGRLLEAQKTWAIDLGKSNLAALTTYLATATPIAALNATQTGGRQPAGQQDENGLTPDELAVCSATGVAPKDFAAAKKS